MSGIRARSSAEASSLIKASSQSQGVLGDVAAVAGCSFFPQQLPAVM